VISSRTAGDCEPKKGKGGRSILPLRLLVSELQTGEGLLSDSKPHTLSRSSDQSDENQQHDGADGGRDDLSEDISAGKKAQPWKQ
jgi:hypothetical protein